MAIDESRWQAAKYGTSKHPITVQNGTDPLPPSSPASAGQTDATLRFDAAQANAADKAQREAEAAKKAQVQYIAMPDPTPAPDAVVTVGPVRLYPQTLTGYEASFTRGGHDPYVFEVAATGERLTTAAGMTLLYELLQAVHAANGKSK